MATLYVIPNWDKDFETPRSRDIVNATYFCVGNSFDGRRVRRLQRLDEPLALYGAFHVICALASKCPYRGVLLDDRGPLDAIDIAEKSGFADDVPLFKRALEQLSAPMIALLEKHDIEQEENGDWPLPKEVARWAMSAEDRRRLRASGRGSTSPQSPPSVTRGRTRTHADTDSGSQRPPADTRGRTQPHASGTVQTGTEQTGTELPSAVSLPGDSQPKQDFIVGGRIILPTDHRGKDQAIMFAKACLCKKILAGKDPGRPWSRDAMDSLTKLLESGLPLYEIDRIGWFRSLPKAADVPELRDRRDPITETTLVNFWGDEFTRAEAYFQKTNRSRNGGAPKKEPPRWRELFKWKYGDDVRLPATYAELDQDQRDEYTRDFQTFEEATVGGAGIHT